MPTLDDSARIRQACREWMNIWGLTTKWYQSTRASPEASRQSDRVLAPTTCHFSLVS
jgi:hypothetical protein